MSTPQQIKKVAAKAAYGTVTPRRIKKAEEEEEEKEVAAGAVTPRRVTSAVTSIVSSNKVIEIYKEVLNNLENKNTIVKVDLQYVRNLGNYESIRVNLGVEDSVREGENANAAMDRVYAFVEKKLIEKMEEIESELKGGK